MPLYLSLFRFTLTSSFVLAVSLVWADSNVAHQTTRPAGYKPLTGSAKAGKILFNSTKISTNGMSCASCHANHGLFSASFAEPYPHKVSMAHEQLGRSNIYLDEMIQACMVIPMKAKAFAWDSQGLADLTAYSAELQKTFKPEL